LSCSTSVGFVRLLALSQFLFKYTCLHRESKIKKGVEKQQTSRDYCEVAVEWRYRRACRNIVQQAVLELSTFTSRVTGQGDILKREK